MDLSSPYALQTILVMVALLAWPFVICYLVIVLARNSKENRRTLDEVSRNLQETNAKLNSLIDAVSDIKAVNIVADKGSHVIFAPNSQDLVSGYHPTTDREADIPNPTEITAPWTELNEIVGETTPPQKEGNTTQDTTDGE